MGHQLVPTYLMKRYVDEGMSRQDVVLKLKRDHNLVVTPQAVTNWKRRYGYEPEQVKAMPWNLRPEHVQAYPAKMVRNHLRAQRGGALTKESAKRLESWLRRLAEVDAVVHYDGDTPQGFFYVARRPGVDTGIVREPQAA